MMYTMSRDSGQPLRNYRPIAELGSRRAEKLLSWQRVRVGEPRSGCCKDEMDLPIALHSKSFLPVEQCGGEKE